MKDTNPWITALRSSQDRLAAMLESLDEDAARQPSYDTEWSIAQVASHLGSQAEIFELFLDAGLDGQDAPGGDRFGPIWERWNAKPAGQQVADSITVGDQLVTRFEATSEAQREAFSLAMFGATQDFSGLASLRLGEHALHSWDVAVALNPAAVLPADAVDLLAATLPPRVAGAAKPADSPKTLAIETTSPALAYLLTTGPDVVITSSPQHATVDLRLPAEAFIRLVVGRLDPGHTPAEIEGSAQLPELRQVFPGI